MRTTTNINKTFEQLVRTVTELNNGQLPGGFQKKVAESQRSEFWTVGNTTIPTIDSPIGKLIGRNGRKIIENLLHETGTDFTEDLDLRHLQRTFENSKKSGGEINVEDQLIDIVSNVGYRTSAFIASLIKHKKGLGIKEKGPDLDLTTSDGYRIKQEYDPTSGDIEQLMTLPHGTKIFTDPYGDKGIDYDHVYMAISEPDQDDHYLELDHCHQGFSFT